MEGVVGKVPRRFWPLLLVARDALGVDGPDSLDPVRIQKGMFLLSMRGPMRNLYDFHPYNWGPFSSDLYADLDSLRGDGFIATEPVSGRTWPRYAATTEGAREAIEVARSLPNTTVSWLGETRRFLTSRSFTRLLSDVYDMYPEYATNSRFRR